MAAPAGRASQASSFIPPVLAGGGGSDYEDEAQPAYAGAEGDVFGGSDDGPPLDELEAQMRGELSQRGELGGERAARVAEESDEADTPAGSSLPELEALVERLPAEVRETLDELFRARFVSVKKLPKKVFQAAGGKAPPAAP